MLWYVYPLNNKFDYSAALTYRVLVPGRKNVGSNPPAVSVEGYNLSVAMIERINRWTS